MDLHLECLAYIYRTDDRYVEIIYVCVSTFVIGMILYLFFVFEYFFIII